MSLPHLRLSKMGTLACTRWQQVPGPFLTWSPYYLPRGRYTCTWDSARDLRSILNRPEANPQNVVSPSARPATTFGCTSGQYQPLGDGSVLSFKGTNEEPVSFTPSSCDGRGKAVESSNRCRVKQRSIGAILLLASPAFASCPPPSRRGLSWDASARLPRGRKRRVSGPKSVGGTFRLTAPSASVNRVVIVASQATATVSWLNLGAGGGQSSGSATLRRR
ncbi:hypothetical protein EDB81DRAFT_493391 [Dactylonectria macrodidyma]|uniref:Uncharacterized protein n=1 Tax=Dactylonectria macrodidyma TaxID=307937 RepID=A0A9P9EXJ6_9HYPO|nr:hypothetical protein EDB81DRAFT_493391 [Dactylonectria macrodidyma]